MIEAQRSSKDLPSRLRYLIDVALLTAKYSKCDRARVGCVISDVQLEKFVVGTNGGPKGGHDGCVREETGNCGCLHAEVNAIAKADSGPKVAVLTLQPCYNCAVLLINADVKEVYYVHPYRDASGVELLDKHSIPCIGINLGQTALLKVDIDEPYR